jgi:hypothetical protein
MKAMVIDKKRRMTPQKPKETFPPGFLLEYFTPERDKEEISILSGCISPNADM